MKFPSRIVPSQRDSEPDPSFLGRLDVFISSIPSESASKLLYETMSARVATLTSSSRSPIGARRTPGRRTSGRSEPLTFAIGDNVFISNTVGHVSPRRPTARDRAGVVVDLTPCRVHVKTANGDYTSRKPSNLRRLHPDDYAAIVNSRVN